MRNLAVFACLGLLVVSVAVACSGDDRVKHLSDGGSGGLGDGGLGGADGVGHGGGSSNPAAGSGGAPQLAAGGLGGAPEVSGNGGTGAPSPVEDGGTSGVGGGGAAVDCPAQRGDFTYQCGEVEALWSPAWSNALGRFELDVSNLPFAIESGTVSFFIATADFQECGTVPVVVSGNTVSAAPAGNLFSPVNVRITNFALVDVCGNHHDYDPAGAPNCNDIRGSGNGFADYALTCNARVAATCPELCQE